MFTKEAGLSLLEVMLALLMGSLVILGIAQLFGQAGAAYRLILSQSHSQEVADFSLRQIGSRLQFAGNFGCATGARLNNLRAPWQHLFEFDIRSPVQLVGHRQFTQSNWMSRLPVSKPVNNGLTYIARRGINSRFYQPDSAVKPGLLSANSDVLVARQSRPPFFRLAEAQTGAAALSILLEDHNRDGRLNLADLDNFGFGRGRDPIVWVGDCRHQVVFRVTGVKLAGDRALLYHKAGRSGDGFENKQANLLPAGEWFSAQGRVGAIETSLFYVATGTAARVGFPKFSLWYKQGVQAPQELVEGVEQLRLFAGLDTDGDSVANHYVEASEVVDPAAIRTIRLALLVGDAGSDPQAFTRTLHLRNP